MCETFLLCKVVYTQLSHPVTESIHEPAEKIITLENLSVCLEVCLLANASFKCFLLLFSGRCFGG